MKINTNVFAITLRADRLYVRLGTYAYGLEVKLTRLNSYCRWNWGVASWLLFRA